MTPAPRTYLLAGLLFVAVLCASVACARMNRARSAADAARDDLKLVQKDLADLSRWHSGPLASAPRNADDPELNRRLRAAATDAGVSEQLASIEPGVPQRVPNAAYLQTPVFIRLNAATLRQVVVLLMRLTENDPAARVRNIELSPANVAGNTKGETWTADLTLAYLVYSPTGTPGADKAQ